MTRVSIVGLNYLPEPTGIAPYTAGLTDHLRDRGHEVHVTTGFPHYPSWHIDPRYGGEVIDERIHGVEVRRLRHYVPEDTSMVRRSRLEVSFGRRLASGESYRRIADSDVVVCVSPALIASGILIDRLRLARNRPAIGVWVQDLYGRGVLETGRARAAHLANSLEAHVLKRSDGLVVLHDRFSRYAIDQLGVRRDKVTVVPNWTHISAATDHSRRQARRSLGWDPDAVLVVHTGNMGVKQGLENVVHAARLARARHSRVRFVLVGDGNQRAKIAALAADVPAIDLCPPLPERLYADALAAADVLLVNEGPGVREMAVPSKLTSYLAAGRPVVAASHEDSLTAQEVARSGAGLRVDPASPEALLDAVEWVAGDPPLAARLSSAALRHAAEVLRPDLALDQLETWVTGLAAARHPRSVSRTARRAGLAS